MRVRTGPPNSSYTGTPRALPLMSSSAFSIAAIARWLTPLGACCVRLYRSDEIAWTGRGSCPIRPSAMPWMTAVRPRLPSASVYSDQPVTPSSVVTFRNENVRQPASQCRSSTFTIFMGLPLSRRCAGLLDHAGAAEVALPLAGDVVERLLGGFLA